MRIPKLFKETSLFAESSTITGKVDELTQDIEDAKTTATNYITETADGIMVHPDGDTTTGWSIKSALELLKGGLSCFKVWLDSSVTKVRVGLETAGHTVFSPDGMEVFSDSTTSVAEFGDDARIGKSDGNHVVIDDDSIDMSHSGVDMAHFGYGEGNASSSTGTAPYYTLGVRRSTTAAYSPSSTYAVGDHVRYDGTEYVCITAIPTAEPWTAAHWTIAIGNYSVTEGFDATASGYCSHAEGRNTFARACSHAEGANTIASGQYSHAEGAYTTASEPCCHAEGYETTASRTYSHAEGYRTTASGQYSHAEGAFTTASGYISHAQNYGAVAAYNNQTAIGKFNDNQFTNAFEIGNGTDANNRSNAFAVDWSGRPTYGTDVSTSVLADIISAESGVTFTRANYVQSGRIAMLELRFTLGSAISVPAGGNIGDITIGTLVTGKQPATNCHPVSNGDGAGTSSYYIGTDGKLLMCGVEGTGVARTINAGMEFTLACTYIIA